MNQQQKNDIFTVSYLAFLIVLLILLTLGGIAYGRFTAEMDFRQMMYEQMHNEQELLKLQYSKIRQDVSILDEKIEAKHATD